MENQSDINEWVRFKDNCKLKYQPYSAAPIVCAVVDQIKVQSGFAETECDHLSLFGDCNYEECHLWKRKTSK